MRAHQDRASPRTGLGAEAPASPVCLNDAELSEAPPAFRAAIAIARRNWEAGTLTFVLPSGRELRMKTRTARIKDS